ncbi:hypothetical protein BH09PAT1_BH09PAT1_4980 [soil metagenome]
MKERIKNYFAKEILSYLSSEEEKLLYVGKPAGIILAPKLAAVALLDILFYVSLHLITLTYFDNTLSYIMGLIVLAFATCYLILFAVLDWLFDFYIVTNKKIIDIHYAPPISHNLSTILLDQVRCTEVDMQKNGLLHEVLDIGDVTITFDRPTHQESFIFHSIPHPEKVSLYLGQVLTSNKRDTIVPFWFRTKTDYKHLLIGEDINSPLYSLGPHVTQ